MARKRVFTSFDYDHDQEIKTLLVGQSRNTDSPFDLEDWSVKVPMGGDWRAQVREKMRRCDLVIVVCGEHTDTATGVDAEVRIAQEENIPYFLIWGRSDTACKKPRSARSGDKIYKWTWDNLKVLVGGVR